jgi:thiamine transport system ATP-binding protein
MTGAAVELSRVALQLGAQRFAFDLQVAAGQFVAVVGPSGAGKSTLFNLIAGFETPDAGRLTIGGDDMTNVAPGKRPISLVFQDNNLFAHLDVFTNVALGIRPDLRLTGAETAAVAAALARVGLRGHERRRPGTLSGGERQRAAFARALVRRRPLVLLDEPFAALDQGFRQDMGTLLTDLHRDEGFTVLMITHDLDEARSLADHFVAIEAGRVVRSGAIEDIEAPGSR